MRPQAAAEARVVREGERIRDVMRQLAQPVICLHAPALLPAQQAGQARNARQYLRIIVAVQACPVQQPPAIGQEVHIGFDRAEQEGCLFYGGCAGEIL